MATNQSDSEDENYCYNCQEDGHATDRCPEIICHGCKANGHTKANCPLGNAETPPQTPEQQFGMPNQPLPGPSSQEEYESEEDDSCDVCQQDDHKTQDCPNIICMVCKTKGHIKANCPSRMCGNCNQQGHDAKDCNNTEDIIEFHSVKPSSTSGLQIRTDIFETKHERQPESDRSTQKDSKEGTPYLSSSDEDSTSRKGQSNSSRRTSDRSSKRSSSDRSMHPRSPNLRSSHSSYSRRDRQRSRSPRHSRSRSSERRSRMRSRGRERESRRRSRSRSRSRSRDRHSPRRHRSDRSESRDRSSPHTYRKNRSRSPHRDYREQKDKQPKHKRIDKIQEWKDKMVEVINAPMPDTIRTQPQAVSNNLPPQPVPNTLPVNFPQYPQISEPFPNFPLLHMPPPQVENVQAQNFNLLEVAAQNFNLIEVAAQNTNVSVTNSLNRVVTKNIQNTSNQNKIQEVVTETMNLPTEKASSENVISLDNDLQSSTTGDSTSCSSWLILKAIPPQWHPLDLKKYLSGMGLNLNTHYFKYEIKYQTGFKIALIQFASKSVAVLAKSKMEVNAKNPTILTSISFHLDNSPLRPISLLRPQGLQKKKTCGKPMEKGMTQVMFVTITMQVELGKHIKTICATIQEKTLVYNQKDGDIDLFFGLLADAILKPLKAMSAQSNIDTAVLIFQSVFMAHMFLKSIPGYLPNRGTVLMNNVAGVLISVQSQSPLVALKTKMPLISKLETANAAYICAAFDELMTLKCPKLTESQLEPLSTFVKFCPKLLPCYMSVNLSAECIELSLMINGIAQSFLLSERTDVSPPNYTEYGKTLFRSNLTQKMVHLNDLETGVSKIKEYLSQMLTPSGADQLVLCSSSDWLSSATLAYLSVEEDFLVKTFAGTCDLMSLLKETLNAEQILSKAVDILNLSLEDVFTKLNIDVSQNVLKGFKANPVKMIEEIFKHQEIDTSESLAKCMNVVSSDFSLRRDQAMKVFNRREIRQYSYDAVQVQGIAGDVNAPELILLVPEEYSHSELIPVKMEVRSNPEQFFANIIGGKESFVIKPNCTLLDYMSLKPTPSNISTLIKHLGHVDGSKAIYARKQGDLSNFVTESPFSGESQVFDNSKDIIESGYSLLFLGLSIIHVKGEITGANICLFDVMDSSVVLEKTFSIDAVILNQEKVLSSFDIQENIYHNIVKPLLQTLQQNNAAVIAYRLYDILHPLIEVCKGIGKLHEFNVIELFADLRWIFESKFDTGHMSWKKQVLTAMENQHENHGTITLHNMCVQSCKALKFLFGNELSSKAFLNKYFIGWDDFSILKNSHIRVKITTLESGSLEPDLLLVKPVPTKELIKVNLLPQQKATIPPLPPAIGPIGTKEIEKRTPSKVQRLKNAAQNISKEIHTVIYLNLKMSTTKEILALELFCNEYSSTPLCITLLQKNSSFYPGRLTLEQATEQITQYLHQVQGKLVGHTFVLCVPLTSFLHYALTNFSCFTKVTKKWIDLNSLNASLNAGRKVIKAPFEEGYLVEKIFNATLKQDLPNSLAKAMHCIVKSYCPSERAMTDFVKENSNHVELPSEKQYIPVYIHIESTVTKDEDSIISEIYVLDRCEETQEEMSTFFPIFPSSEHEKYFKDFKSFEKDKHGQWKYVDPDSKKSRKCVYEHEAIQSFVKRLEGIYSKSKNDGLVLLFLSQNGGYSLLLKSLIENNVPLEKLKNVVGVGDVVTALKVSGKRKSYAYNLEGIQEKYSEIARSHKEFQIFSDRGSKRKAKATLMFHERELDGTISRIMYPLWSPYSNNLLHHSKSPIFLNSHVLLEILEDFSFNTKARSCKMKFNGLIPSDKPDFDVKLKPFETQPITFKESIKKVRNGQTFELEILSTVKHPPFKCGDVIGYVSIATQKDLEDILNRDIAMLAAPMDTINRERIDSKGKKRKMDSSKNGYSKVKKSKKKVTKDEQPKQIETKTIEPEPSTNSGRNSDKKTESNEETKSQPNFRTHPTYSARLGELTQSLEESFDYLANFSLFYELYIGCCIIEDKEDFKKDICDLVDSLDSVYDDSENVFDELNIDKSLPPTVANYEKDISNQKLVKKVVGDNSRLFIELVCLHMSSSFKNDVSNSKPLPEVDRNFLVASSSNITLGKVECIGELNATINTCNQKFQVVKHEVLQHSDLAIDDIVICSKQSFWKVIPIKHWKKLSNSAFGFISEVDNKRAEILVVKDMDLVRFTIERSKLLSSDSTVMTGQPVALAWNKNQTFIDLGIVINNSMLENLDKSILLIDSNHGILRHLDGFFPEVDLKSGFILDNKTCSLLFMDHSFLVESGINIWVEKPSSRIIEVPLDEIDEEMIQKLCTECDIILRMNALNVQSTLVGGTEASISTFQTKIKDLQNCTKKLTSLNKETPLISQQNVSPKITNDHMNSADTPPSTKCDSVNEFEEETMAVDPPNSQQNAEVFREDKGIDKNSAEIPLSSRTDSPGANKDSKITADAENDDVESTSKKESTKTIKDCSNIPSVNTLAVQENQGDSKNDNENSTRKSVTCKDGESVKEPDICSKEPTKVINSNESQTVLIKTLDCLKRSLPSPVKTSKENVPSTGDPGESTSTNIFENSVQMSSLSGIPVKIKSFNMDDGFLVHMCKSGSFVQLTKNVIVCYAKKNIDMRNLKDIVLHPSMLDSDGEPNSTFRASNCFHLQNSVFLVIAQVPRKVSKREKDSPIAIMKCGNNLKSSNEPLKLPLKLKTVTSILYLHEEAEFGKDNHKKSYVSLDAIALGAVEVIELPQNIRVKISKLFDVFVPHYFIMNNGKNPLVILQSILSVITRKKFMPIKEKIEGKLNDIPKLQSRKELIKPPEEKSNFHEEKHYVSDTLSLSSEEENYQLCKSYFVYRNCRKRSCPRIHKISNDLRICVSHLRGQCINDPCNYVHTSFHTALEIVRKSKIDERDVGLHPSDIIVQVERNSDEEDLGHTLTNRQRRSPHPPNQHVFERVEGYARQHPPSAFDRLGGKVSSPIKKEPVDTSSTSTTRKSRPCPFYQNGYCRFGENCYNLHLESNTYSYVDVDDDEFDDYEPSTNRRFVERD